ncbi:MAG: alanine racemase [Candidatus Omnitrophica bacterium]|nr:alanine racemase [Candidatus Omnitrophota bacterium]MDD5429583.1 alanine racemase [Candidatus Omnitrophota bacterium]
MIRPLWIEVNLKQLSRNLKAIRKHLKPGVKVVATIKQSAYGHGLIPVARELSSQGIDSFGVGSIEEAIALREDGFGGSILVLSAVLDKYAGFFIRYKVTPSVVDIKFISKLNKEASKIDEVVPVHIEMDTGMGRLGFACRNVSSLAGQLKRFKNIKIEGVYTHFPVADSDPDFTNYQINSFNKFIKELDKEGITPDFRHCANSTGLINYPKAHFNMVRPGLILYGVTPDLAVQADVKPVLSLKSKVIFIKKVKKGTSIGYGRIFFSKCPGYIATVAVGYADGYPWSLSNCSRVIINGSFLNIAGRVCMDHIMVDAGKSKVSVGDDVILIGSYKNLKITAEDLAQLSGTIPYEIVSRLSLKIPRIYKS